MAMNQRGILIGVLFAWLTAEAAAQDVDPRYRSPRATIRTFYTAMNLAEEDTEKLRDAIDCLDFSTIPRERQDLARTVFQLESVLRALAIPSLVVPDYVEGSDYTLGDDKELKVTLHRGADGRWRFSRRTVEATPAMRLVVYKRVAAANQAKESKEASDVPAEFRTPFALIETFLKAFKDEDLDTAAKCLDLSEVPDPARPIVGRALAYKLKEVLDRTIFVVLQDVPDTPAALPLEALARKEGRITVDRVTGGPRKGQWLFDRGTARSLDGLYEALASAPIVPELAAIGHKAAVPEFRHAPGLWLRHGMPSVLRYRIELTHSVSVALYHVLGLVALGLLVVPVYRLVITLAAPPARAVMRRRLGPTDGTDVAFTVRPLGGLAVLVMLVLGVGLLDLRTSVAGVLLAVLEPLLRIAATLVVYRLVDPVLKLLAGPAALQERATTTAAMALPVFSLVLKIVVAMCGLASVLQLFDFDVATVLTGLGIGGLAVALAAQDTLKNFFGSLMLIADRTFRVGDLIQVGAIEGVVESVGIRSTRMRGLDDALLTIPNGDLTTTHVTNFGARRHRRFRVQLAVPHGTTADRLVAFRDGLLTLLREHPQVRPDSCEVGVHDVAAPGVEILILAFFDVSDAHAELAARDRLVLDILRLAERLEIAFESPTIVLERERHLTDELSLPAPEEAP
jgi:MscS family membrane protein